MSRHGVAASLLLALLDSAGFATAVRRTGKPGRIRVPDDEASRAALVTAHLRGAPATIEFHAEGHSPWRERVEAVVLAAYSPGADGQCRWVALDLDAADHGQGGLADPSHAVRTIAERADHAGLYDGLLVARSRRGQGRHVFLVLPSPVCLDDAVIGVAALVAAAFRVAVLDVIDGERPHAFRCVNGAIARPGDAGAVELVPRSTLRPTYGWSMLLPGAGALASHGGGIVVDPFTDQPIKPVGVPRCNSEAWTTCVSEASAALAERCPPESYIPAERGAAHTPRTRQPLDRIDSRTEAFLDGRVSEGARNCAAFAAAANLLGCGVSEREAERLILAGAVACGLPEREARAAFRSAVNAVSRRGPR